MARPKSLFTRQVLLDIQKWARHCERDENYKWTKWDSAIYFLLETEIKLINHNYYVKTKSSAKNTRSSNKG